MLLGILLWNIFYIFYKFYFLFLNVLVLSNIASFIARLKACANWALLAIDATEKDYL
jgi:hypothetical protein